MKTIFLVEDQVISPGRIYAIFANEEDAIQFADELEAEFESEGVRTSIGVEERNLWYGQPPNLGYNV